METLLDIFNKHGCDKGTEGRIAHHYYRAYEKDFEAVRNDPIKILEVGIYKGLSHTCWLEYFPNAEVYGIDIFDRVKPFHIPVLRNPRMHYINHDSRDPDLPLAIKEAWGEDIKFDFIIDDGLHTPDANRKTFLNLIDFKKENGVYFIEDVFPLHKLTEREWKFTWLKRLPDEYNEQKYRRFMSVLKKYRVGVFDMRRTSRKPDSVIYRVVEKDVK